MIRSPLPSPQLRLEANTILANEEEIARGQIGVGAAPERKQREKGLGEETRPEARPTTQSVTRDLTDKTSLLL